MLKRFLTSEMKSRFPNMAIEYGGKDDDVIATIAPVHTLWEPIVVCEDGDEVIVYFGDFTHVHYGYFDEETSSELEAQVIAENVVDQLRLVFDDQLEFFKFWGGGGFRSRGSQGTFSKVLFGANGILWSGKGCR